GAPSSRWPPIRAWRPVQGRRSRSPTWRATTASPRTTAGNPKRSSARTDVDRPMPRLIESPPLPQDLTPSQQARRAGIVAAGLALLRESEYEKIQMRDVAIEAG